MTRLPQPGADDGSWGDILNDFLRVEHNDDGTLKSTGSLATKATDSAVVHLAGAETIAGSKTFLAPPTVPTPTAGGHAVTKTYADAIATAGVQAGAFTAKGDVLAGTGASTFSKVTVGSNGQVLVADSTQTTGVKWSTSTSVTKDTIFINTADHGLALDGVTDDVAAFQAMITTYGANKIYRFPMGANMLIKSPLTLNVSNVVLEGSGRGLTTITMDSTMTGASSNALILNSAPTFGTSFALVASTNIGDTAVSVSSANAATFAVGDYVLVRSNALVDTNKHQGEVKIVKSVDSANGLVYFQDRVYFPYLLSDSATIIKVSVLQDVTIRGITFKSAATGTPTPSIAVANLLAQYVDGLKVEGCEWRDVWYTASDFTSCLNATFEGNRVDHVQTTTASATIRYGIWVASASRNVTVANNHFNRCRHSVTVGTHGTTNYEGLIRDLTVIGNTSVASDTAHFDCHQPLDGGTITGNTCIGGISYLDPAAQNVNGIQIRGKNVTVSGNKISGIIGSGIAIQGDSLHTAQSITVTGNIINECYAPRTMSYLSAPLTLSASFTASVLDTTNFTASGTIRLNGTDSFTYTGKTATTLTGCTSAQTTTYPAGASLSQTGSGGIGIELDSAATLSGCVIVGNSITATDSSAIRGQGSQNGVLVANNYCKNNNRRVSAASIQFGSAIGPIVVRDNTIETNNLSRPVSITGSDGHNVSGNSFVNNALQTVSVAGTNSAIFNNTGLNPIGPFSLGSITGAITVTRVNGDSQYGTLTGNITVTLTSGSAIGDELTLVLTQDATGSRTLSTSGTNIKWANSSAPILSTTANVSDLIKFSWSGANWIEVARSLSDATNTSNVVDTAIPIADSVTASAGITGKVSGSGHTHPRTNWTALDHGLLSWSYDPSLGSASSTPLATAGTMTVVKLHNPISQTVTNLCTYVVTAGATLTSGQCFAALYQGGIRLGITADQSAAWVSTGFKNMAIAGGAIVVPAGDVYVGLWFNGTTGPAPLRAVGNSSANLNISGSVSRYGTADTGLTTTAPATLGTVSGLSVSYWVGLS